MRQQPYNLNIRHNFFKHCKDLKKLIKRKKYLFRKAIFDKLSQWRETDPKQYWQLLNSLKYGDKENIQNADIHVNTDQLCQHLQNQGKPDTFNAQFSQEVDNHIENYKNILNENEITDKPFSITEIKKCIEKLKLGKSAGPDRISNEIIKYSSIVTSKSIVKLFNLILESGNYPTKWRNSFIILIFKKGDRTDLNNYRGISLQNCIAKLFSSVLNNRLINHYENLFADQQFGFRQNHRTTDSIFVLKTLISKYLNKKKQKIFACFVDLRKAFDSLWHNGLLYKLKLNGIGKKYYSIISDMYKCCKSAVKIQHKVSDFIILF